MTMPNLFTFLLIAVFPLVPPGRQAGNSDDPDIKGEWVRIGPAGPIALHFKTNGLVEGDFGNDQTIEIISAYSIQGDQITFTDREGVTCPDAGIYKIYLTDYYMAFDLIEDPCAGRLRSTMGFWVRPDFNDLLIKISGEIEASADPEDYLNRARMLMAIGEADRARQDFDRYIKHDSTDARVYVNRAGARMPGDLQGVVDDCNRAISLEPVNKNAYFLRGLALYGLGKKEQACEDFYRAIELGFTVLKEAEYDKCSTYWKSMQWH
jgi:tetratricopeptide (TPR) repeat protein